MNNRVDYSWLSNESIMESRKFWMELAGRTRRRFLESVKIIRSDKGEKWSRSRLLHVSIALRSLALEAQSLREVRRMNGELRRRARALRFG